MVRSLSVYIWKDLTFHRNNVVRNDPNFLKKPQAEEYNAILEASKDIIRWRIADNVLNGWCHGLKTNDVVGTDDGYVRVENRTFNANKTLFVAYTTG